MNGADLLAASLKTQGVEWISTLCGHGLNEIFAACRRAGIRLVDTRNEQTAAYMAECRGRLSGQVGVCAVSSGVAHANAMTGVVNAHFDGAPMLLLTGAGPRQTAGLGHFQDLDQVALAAPVCKTAGVLDLPERIPGRVREVFAAARSGRPGPVHLSFPMDVQTATVEAETPRGEKPVTPAAPTAAAVEEAAALLVSSSRPLLVAGSGVFYAAAADALQGFAAALSLPVVVPIWDRGSVQAAMPEFIGVAGAASGGPPLLETADLLLVLGAEADYRLAYLRPPGLAAGVRVIRVDSDAARLARGPAADLPVQADPGLFLAALEAACLERGAAGFATWLKQAKEERDGFEKRVRVSARRDGRLHALDILEALDRVLVSEAALVVDGGNIGQWFHQTLGRRRYPGHWLSCGASGVVGYGIAGAMAARLEDPDRQVVLLSGDGAATFNIADLECAARQKLPFVMVVADDEAWGVVESGDLEHYGEVMCSHLGPLDFAGVARALGARGERVETAAELVAALREGLRQEVPMLIHAPISGGLPAGS